MYNIARYSGKKSEQGFHIRFLKAFPRPIPKIAVLKIAGDEPRFHSSGRPGKRRSAASDGPIPRSRLPQGGVPSRESSAPRVGLDQLIKRGSQSAQCAFSIVGTHPSGWPPRGWVDVDHINSPILTIPKNIEFAKFDAHSSGEFKNFLAFRWAKDVRRRPDRGMVTSVEESRFFRSVLQVNEGNSIVDHRNPIIQNHLALRNGVIDQFLVCRFRCYLIRRNRPLDDSAVMGRVDLRLDDHRSRIGHGIDAKGVSKDLLKNRVNRRLANVCAFAIDHVRRTVRRSR